MNLPISRSEAAKELIRRRSIRRSLTEWCRYAGYEPARHHRLLIDKLEAITRGEIDRLAVFMPPGAAKSTYASILFTPWYLAQFPEHCVIAASHTQELAEKWGRRVRNLISEHALILGCALASDSQAAGRWETGSGGEYFAAGVGGSITGRRADLVVIDDPVRSREDADSELIRDKTWDWYTTDLYTRLKPGGRIVLIQCMAGDTPVLMADGRERPIRDIRAGDIVATYDNGVVSTSRVRNWINNGPDRVFEIRMKSGIIVKANARHPFLVEKDGERLWLRTAVLKRGDAILRVIGESGAELNVGSVTSQQRSAAYATLITIRTAGSEAFARLRSILHRGVRRTCDIAMGLISWNMNASLPPKAEFVQSASGYPKTRRDIGVTHFASITATKARKSEDCCATAATSWSETGAQSKSYSQQLSTCEIVKDEIAEISFGGVEDVFDVEIDRTGNFIAGGLISHNTRWHEDDLAGRLLAEQAAGGDKWEIISLPALAEGDDPLGRAPGEPLWPEWEGLEELERKRALNARNWSALYQQRPAPEEGDYFKAEWLKPYDKAPARDTLRIYGGSDYAVTSDGGDYTVHCVVGLDPEGRMYLLDLWRGQTSSDLWVESFCDLVRDWKPIGWAEETGQIRSGVGPYMDRRQRDRKAYVAREAFPTRGDKAIRAQSIRGRMAQEGLYVPIHASWYPALRSELLSFPAGKHDDQVDALGLVGQLLDKMLAGQKPRPNERPPRDKYNRDKGEELNWKTA